ncbi:MAG: hypothetical protein KDD44_03000 [Bdellovibrionales bacterium]|nr:hypothetical protein [Bdellovibrionales bacterium]
MGTANCFTMAMSTLHMDDTDGSPCRDKKYALVLLIKEIMSQLDEVASLRSRGLNADLSRYLLTEMCGVLHELEPALQKLYFEYLLLLVPATSHPPRVSVEPEYVQSVRNAKERFVTTMRQELLRAA